MFSQSTSAVPTAQELPPLPEAFDGSAIRYIPEFPGYAVTDHGEVWSCRRHWRRDKRLKHTWWKKDIFYRLPDQHPRVLLCIADKQRAPFVHQLVLLTFVGPCPSGMECCHEDDNPENNHLSNLRWGTHKENMADSKRNGRQRYVSHPGERNGRAVLTDADIPEILRLRREEGWTTRQLVARFGVSQMTIDGIIAGTKWKHIPRDTPLP